MDLEKEFRKYASKDAFFYITLDPERALGIEDILPNYTIICPYKSWLTDDLKSKKISTLVLEEKMKIREVEKIAEKGSYGILQSEAARRIINYLTESTRNRAGSDPARLRANILVLKTSYLIEDFCKRQRWRLFAPKARLAEKFENKISQYKLLKNEVFYPKSYLRTISGVYKTPPEFPFVLQFNRGHSGNSTFFINRKDGLGKLYKSYPNREVKTSEFIRGKTYTLNCLVLTNGKIVTGSISEQITGLKEATNNPNTTVGNDWGSARKLKHSCVSEIKHTAEKVGKVLYGEGYRGLFGIDVLIEEESDKLYFIELNTHQPASVSFEAKIHRKINKIPLIALFILDSICEISSARDVERCISRIKDSELPPIVLPINAKQVIYRNKESKILMRDELLKNYRGKKFSSRLLCVKPNEEVWRAQYID